MKLSTILACVVAALLVDGTVGGLLKVPKVYNALITTNEKLVPSRAFSVSAPVFQPIGLTPLISPAPPVIVSSPYISVGEEEKPEAEAKPDKVEEEKPKPEEKKPENKNERPLNAAPVIAPFSLPLAYYNSLTYYHSVWPYSYSAFNPASFVFTAPFAYPGVFGDLYGTFPLNIGKRPAADAKKPEPEVSGTKEEIERDSVTVDAS